MIPCFMAYIIIHSEKKSRASDFMGKILEEKERCRIKKRKSLN